MTAIKIDEDVIDVLASADVIGNHLALIEQLDRKLYVRVKKVLEAIGGKWQRSSKTHLFEEDAADVLDKVLLTGEYSRTKQDFGQFFTPNDIADELVAMAQISDGMQILEPSYGSGQLIRAIKRKEARTFDHYFITACEIVSDKTAGGPWERVTIHRNDFLKTGWFGAFDCVLMNPPFARQADIAHVMHAWDCLKPGGRLVAIVSAGAMFRTDRKAKAFQEFFNTYGGYKVKLAEGAFKESGTMVDAYALRMDKP